MASHRLHGQMTLEYAVLIAVICAALLGMQIYVKRALQGGFRDAAGQIGVPYSPRHTTSLITDTVATKTTTLSKLDSGQSLPGGGVGDVRVTTTTTPSDVTSRQGVETVGPLDDEALWE